MANGWVVLLAGVLILTVPAVRAMRARPAARRASGRTLQATLTAAGALCVVAGAIVMASDTSDATAGPVRVQITDDLASDQVSEQVDVSLDGRSAGTLSIDRRSPSDSLAVTVANAGRHDYRLVVRRQLKGHAPVTAGGHGHVDIDGRGSLTLYSDDRGDTYLMAQP